MTDEWRVVRREESWVQWTFALHVVAFVLFLLVLDTWRDPQDPQI
jgi:hypothetical protein